MRPQGGGGLWQPRAAVAPAGVRRVRVPRSARRRGGAAEVGVLRRRGRQSAADTLGGGDSCMRRRAAVSAVAVLNCEAQSRSGARSAETESFAVVIATSDERYQSEARPNTRSAVGARCSARPHGCSSSSAAGQPAAVCRMECRQARRRPRARRAPRVPRVAGRHESAPVTAEPHRLSEARSLQPIPCPLQIRSSFHSHPSMLQGVLPQCWLKPVTSVLGVPRRRRCPRPALLVPVCRP